MFRDHPMTQLRYKTIPITKTDMDKVILFIFSILLPAAYIYFSSTGPTKKAMTRSTSCIHFLMLPLRVAARLESLLHAYIVSS
jgi:hypothetical protein